MDELITDLISFNGDRQIILSWENFSNPVSNSIKRMLSHQTNDDLWQKGICYEQLAGLSISDLLDTPFVGTLRKIQVLEELQEVFGAFETNGGVFVVSPEMVVEISDSPDAIDAASNFEELIGAILDVFKNYRTIDERTMTILRGRIPAFLTSLRTLDDIGTEYSVTRERIRQIESKFIDLQVEDIKSDNLLLESIVENLELSENENEFVLKLSETNLLGDEPISTNKLKAVLRILSLESLISRVESVETRWDSVIGAEDILINLAQSYRNKFGLIDLKIFTSETGSSDSQACQAIKKAYPRSIIKGNLILARTPKIDTTFENVIGKQLKVFGNLTPEVLLEGIVRQASYRQTTLLGSYADQISLIEEVAGKNPTYEIYQQNTIAQAELSPTDIWFLEIFQDSPSGMMHRNELTAASLRDGKNLSSINVFLLFNPLIRPVGSAVMALANVVIDSENVKRHAKIANATEERTQLDFEFRDSKILLKITPNLNTMAAGVLFPTSDLRSLIVDSVFSVSCECAQMESVQQLRLRPPSFWTGFTALIKHSMNIHNFIKGEEIHIELDFENLKAILILER